MRPLPTRYRSVGRFPTAYGGGTSSRYRSVGFTLIELIIVIVIIGVLTAYAVPQYLRTVEVNKADDVVGLINMIGTTNKMFALDHGNVYVTGQLSASCAPSGLCPTAGPFTDACALVWCRYVANQDFAAKTYDIFACDGNIAAACATLGADKFVSGAKRKTGASSPFDTWGFTMDAKGKIQEYGTGAPKPTY